LCITEWDTFAERGVEDICEKPWKLAFRGKMAVLIYTKVEIVVLWSSQLGQTAVS
jgi:hypothetical protein